METTAKGPAPFSMVAVDTADGARAEPDTEGLGTTARADPPG
jgi:hypothetical protein